MKKLLLISLLLVFNSGSSMAIEEPTYTVETKNSVYEIRSYGPVLVAETNIDAEFDDAGNRAFRILADYIFGNNTAKEKIAMTAPVNQIKSEKIAMTAPVNMSKSGEGYMVQFTMPAKYTIENLPKPNDARVHIRQIPARRVAVYRYSGSWSEKKYKEKLDRLVVALKKDGLQPVGDPIFARFNSPFQIWFLRRNEIWLGL